MTGRVESVRPRAKYWRPRVPDAAQSPVCRRSGHKICKTTPCE